MLGRQRTLKVALATGAIVVSGGTAAAFAATGVASRGPSVHTAAVTDSTDTTVDGASSTTIVDDTTTSFADDTSTTVGEDTTTTVEESTSTTTVAEDTSTTTTVPSSPEQCKPGWGFGDTNHCHSGPPGLVNRGNVPGDGHGHGHGETGHGDDGGD
jgi:hypothetical protein